MKKLFLGLAIVFLSSCYEEAWANPCNTDKDDYVGGDSCTACGVGSDGEMHPDITCTAPSGNAEWRINPICGDHVGDACNWGFVNCKMGYDYLGMVRV